MSAADAGDVTMTAARIARESGSVTGVDADAILGVARRRAEDAGMRTVSFVQASLPGVPLEPAFDAVIVTPELAGAWDRIP
jgi:ubiquinone/menaquinone biosynthesis C-methylase UbiE